MLAKYRPSDPLFITEIFQRLKGNVEPFNTNFIYFCEYGNLKIEKRKLVYQLFEKLKL